MNKNLYPLFVGASLFLISSISNAQDADDDKFDVQSAFMSMMKEARADNYPKALEIIKEVAANTSGAFHLRALHVQMDIHRILGQWEAIPPMVDDFMSKYTKDEQAQKNSTWDAHRMSEKYAAEVALGKNKAAIESSKLALKYYDNLSDTWTVNKFGSWVSKKTGQVCSMVWQGHILYDAYDEINGDTSCQYWDSSMFAGVSLRIYKTSSKSGETSAQNVFDVAMEKSKNTKQGEFSADGGERTLLAAISSDYLVKGYKIEGRAPQKGVIVAPQKGGWLLNMMYSSADMNWAKTSFDKIKGDLK